MELTVYTARMIRTMNESLPTATAVAVAEGEIVEVGSLETLQPWLDAHRHTIDERFADKVLMPGFIDPHLHPSLAAILLPMHFITALEWRLPDRVAPATRSAAAYLAELERVEASLADPNEVLMTWGYHELWHGEMSRQMLNRISDSRPIFVWQRSFHEIYTNDAGLTMSGLDLARLQTHPQVDLERGRFYETGQQLLAAALGPYLTGGDRFIHGLEMTKAAVHAGGHTTIGDLTGGLLDTEAEWQAMRLVLDDDTTPFRVQMVPAGARGMGNGSTDAASALRAERARRDSTRLFYRDHVKLFTDGGFFAQLMRVGSPGFIDGHQGEWMIAPESFEALARTYWNEGLQIHVHCTGDMGLELALDVLEKLQWERPRFDHRFTIEHFGLSTQEQARRIAALGAIVSANVYYLHELGEAYATGSVGHERASQMARLGTLNRHGVVTALHSDFTMAPALPLFNAWVAVNRLSESGAVLAPAERIGVHEAIKAITIDAAYVLGMENEIGSIRAGKKADFTVLDADPYEVAPEDLKDIPIWGTVFEGVPFPLDGVPG